jgi:hypothetical protein
MNFFYGMIFAYLLLAGVLWFYRTFEDKLIVSLISLLIWIGFLLMVFAWPLRRLRKP